jgi:hypothetical protein
MESGEHNLADYNAERIEGNDGTFLHRLLNLLTDKVCTYHVQPGDTRFILFISSSKDVAANMFISNKGTHSAASMLKRTLIREYDFELSKGLAISPNCTDPKYKDYNNRR